MRAQIVQREEKKKQWAYVTGWLLCWGRRKVKFQCENKKIFCQIETKKGANATEWKCSKSRHLYVISKSKTLQRNGPRHEKLDEQFKTNVALVFFRYGTFDICKQSADSQGHACLNFFSAVLLCGIVHIILSFPSATV